MYLTINGFPYCAFPEYSCLAFSTPCSFVPLFPFLAVSTPEFWDNLVPLFPFPLFHVSHFQRPHANNIVANLLPDDVDSAVSKVGVR